MTTAARHREPAVLVGLDIKRPPRHSQEPSPEAVFDAKESLAELVTLAESAGAEVVHKTVQSRSAPDPATLIGGGKVRELRDVAQAARAELVVFDRELSPTQLRNLEREFDCKVLDRTQLILDIFARRARTREGQLQVELAQLNYLLPRLTGRGAAMSRLGGGIGTRGPGETQLETDRRRIRQRIAKIAAQLETVRGGRSIQRKQRQAVPLATIALVGYTNAGKSTLFNRLTGAGVVADARMFATLDPTVRHTRLPSGRKVLLSDTVGFIRNLPTTLVKAFRSTLEEVVEAALLLHVIDAGSPLASEHVAHVRKVLNEIGAGETPQLLVLNKIDTLAGDEPELLASRIAPGEPAVAVSARSGQRMEELIARMDAMLELDRTVVVRFRFPAAEQGRVHWLHELGRVIESEYDEAGCTVRAEVPGSVCRRLHEFLLAE